MAEQTKKRDYSKATSARLLMRLMSPYKGLAWASFITLLLDVTGMLYIPTELSAMVNTAITATDAHELYGHGIAMLVAAILGSGGCISSYYLVSKLAANVGRDMRLAVYKKSLILSGFDFDQFGTGSMITRTLSDANVVQMTILMTFIMVAPAPVGCVVATVLAFGIDPVMGQLLLVIMAIMIVIMVVAVAKSAPIFLIMQSFIDRMNVRLRESITGVRVIRAFGKEKDEQKNLDKTFSDYAENAIHVNMVFAVADSATFFLMNIVEVLIMWFGADRVGVHAMQIGSISALVEYAMIIMFFMMMAQFGILELPRAMACLTRAAAVLSCEPSIKDVANAEALPAETLPAEAPKAHRRSGDIVADNDDVAGAPYAMGAAHVTGERPREVVRFDRVRFRFADADEDTLRNLNFTVRRGQVTAIIGSTGSGKSTIAKLLLRFHDVTQGHLKFMEHDIKKLSQQDLRRHIAYVPQKAWLFSGTIASNLRDGNPNATNEELWHALDVAQASFVRDLPEGLEARVAQGGSNFSGGQRQRLAIARALVRKADLYIFDDSFSALDFKTDAALRHALKDELADAAVLIIAQRVSTIHDASQIVVLQEGEVVGLGTHGELLKNCPTYRAIADSQAKGGKAHE